MIFPSLNLRSRLDPDSANDRIERAINDRHHRLGAGISISPRFDAIRGALVVAQGNGRYLRVRHVVEAVAPVPSSIRAGCLDVLRGCQRDQGEINQLISDLAETQATVVEQLKCHAGKYVDRVLAVAVCDPGVWDRDFDGRISYFPFCDATRLAELSGVTVIDSFPSRDLAVGGSGQALEALPYWVLFADRDRRVASQTRWLVSIDDDCKIYFLPASDGLDAEVPRIKTFSSVGCEFLNLVLKRSFPDALDSDSLIRLSAIGSACQVLTEQWTTIMDEFSLSKEHSKPHSQYTAMIDRLLEPAEAYVQAHPKGQANLVRSALGWIVDRCVEKMSIAQQAAPSTASENTRLIVASPGLFEESLVQQFTRSADPMTISAVGQTGYSVELEPVVAALLGLFHIDQMPANIPWITGGSCQRILGRLTPGRPSNWRQLVRTMADFQPAPMKLKDAI